MKPGNIVLVDWRDALPGSGEPNKHRPAVVVGRADLFHDEFGFLLVVPVTGQPALCIANAAVDIPPDADNRCSKHCYALSWNVQTVPRQRVRETQAFITPKQLHAIRDQIAQLVDR